MSLEAIIPDEELRRRVEGLSRDELLLLVCELSKSSGEQKREPLLTMTKVIEMTDKVQGQEVKKKRYLVLSTDPEEALLQIADCIEKKMVLKGRTYPPGGDKRACQGFWQDIGFIYDLQAIAHQIEERRQ
ncbi:hypothetical protein [Desulfotalea psychrophila]|uniref:hypothetical protein n=1 Tax=Desulfotalea psychrophila TaxID=84980 RepID=UPI00030161BE|nr:hypothetical protein [Desulfotalea psychrophila]